VKLESDSTWGMSKTFRPWKIEEPLFLPPTLQDFVGPDHLSRFVLSLVKEAIDLTEITGTYGSERGQPPFDPTMMTVLLLYAYCCGVYSSRRIAKACRERVDFMSIVGLDAPDFRTISDFRKRHLKALGGLFTQVLRLCEKAGLVKLGHVALDGTKIKANASKHKAMSYGRMEERAAELEAKVAGWLGAAEAADAEEDKLHGRDKTGEEMPKWVADKQRRIEKIRQAKAELEAEAKAAAEAKRHAEAAAAKEREATGRRKGGRPAAPPSDVPDTKAQKNFTDPESRIMKSKDGFVQAYNAQAAVDAEAQIIVAQDVTQSGVDCGQLVPLTDAIEINLGRKPAQLSADAGYCSEANLAALEVRNIDSYVAAGRARDAVAGKGKKGKASAAPDETQPAEPDAAQPTEPDAAQPAAKPSRVEAMRAKIKAGGHESPYRLRKQLPEPVFGQIKQASGFRQFLLRGFENVRAEWAMVCTAHNLRKLAHRWIPSAALEKVAAMT
jgi:transposase